MPPNTPNPSGPPETFLQSLPLGPKLLQTRPKCPQTPSNPACLTVPVTGSLSRSSSSLPPPPSVSLGGHPSASSCPVSRHLPLSYCLCIPPLPSSPSLTYPFPLPAPSVQPSSHLPGPPPLPSFFRSIQLSILQPRPPALCFTPQPSVYLSIALFPSIPLATSPVCSSFSFIPLFCRPSLCLPLLPSLFLYVPLSISLSLCPIPTLLFCSPSLCPTPCPHASLYFCPSFPSLSLCLPPQPSVGLPIPLQTSVCLFPSLPSPAHLLFLLFCCVQVSLHASLSFFLPPSVKVSVPAFFSSAPSPLV